MLKTFRFILLAALTLVCGNMLAEEATLKWEASGSTTLPTAMGSDITLTWEKGTYTNDPKVSYGELYFYNGNRVTFATTSDNFMITKIVFTLGSDGPASLVTCNASGSEESNEGITVTTSPRATTWVGETQSIIFRGSSSDSKTRYIKKIEVTYTNSSSTPIVKVPALAITKVDNFNTSYDMDATDNKTLVAYYENTGSAAAENAKLTLFVDNEENKVIEVGKINAGASDWKNISYDLTKIEAGNHEVYVSLTADGVDAVNSETKTVTFTKAAPQATFTVTAQNVTVANDATNYQVVATVTNTSETVAATGVQVLFQRNIQNIVDPQTIDLAAGETKDVTFTVNAPEGGFTAGALNYWVVVKAYEKTMAQQEITVTVEEATVQQVKDLAVTGIQGSIDQGQESNSLTVLVENKGTVNIEDATITVKAGETVLGTGSLFTTVKAGEEGNTGFSTIAVSKNIVDALSAGELEVTATTVVEGEDADKLENNTFTGKIEVKAAPFPAAKFELTAQAVQTKVGEETFTVKVTVKNVGDAAGAAEVKLVKGTEQLGEAQTTNSLEVNGEQELTFTVANPYTTAGNYDNIQAMTTDNMAGCYVNVAVAPADENKVVDIALVDIRGLEDINLKSETNAVQVWFTNNSTVDNLNATITLTMNGTEVATQTIAKGESYKSFTLPTEGLVAGEQAALVATLTAEGNKEGNLAEVTKTLDIVSGEQTEPTFALTAEKKIEVLTTDKKVKVEVTVENTSDIEARNLYVTLTNGTTTLGEEQFILVLAGGQSQKVTFEFDNFEQAGEYDLTANVKGTSAVAYINLVVAEPTVDMALTDIEGSIDLSLTSTYLRVNYKNEGTADVRNASVVLTYGDNQTLGEGTIAYAKAGTEGFCSVSFSTEGLTAGTLNVTATVTAEGDTKEFNNSVTKEVTVTDTPAAEPTFSVVAADVTVPFGATSFKINATVKNTSEVDGDVEVKLLEGITQIDATTVTIKAGDEAEVGFEIEATEEKPFVAGKTAKYYVQAGNSQAEVTVTFAEEETIKSNDLSVEAIQGTIDLSATQSTVSVTVKNNGEVDAKNVKATLTYGETVLEKTIASIKAGEEGYAYFQVLSEGIEGETLAVTAAIDYADDNADNNTKTAELTVKAAPAAEPTFSLTAEDVEMKAGEGATAIVKVTNTSEVNASGVEVKLLYGTMTVATQTVDIAAGETKDVEFNVTAEQVSGILAALGGKTSAEIQAQAGKNNCFFTVTVVEEVEPVYDLAVELVQGKIDLAQATNFVTVTVKNNGNQDMTDVRVTVDVQGEGNEGDLGEATISVKKGESKTFSVNILTDGLEVGELPVAVKVWVDNDATPTDNVKEATIEVIDSSIVEPAAEIGLNPISSWEVEAGEQTVNVSVTVFNNGDADAKDVTVQIYKAYPTILAEQTVDVPAGEENNYKMLTLSFTYTFEEGKEYEFTAFTNFKDAVADNNMQTFTISCPAPMPDVAVAKIAPITVTTEENVVIAATLKNNSDIDANEVKVGVYTIENLQYQLVGIMQKVDIAAGTEANVEFNLGKLAAGEYTYYVQVSEDANAQNNMQDVTVKVSEPEEQTIDMAITAIQGLSQINLQAENKVSVWYANNGTKDLENVVIMFSVNDDTQEKTVNVAAGKNGYVEFTLDITSILPEDENAELVAWVNVEGDVDNTNDKVTKVVPVVNGEVVEPTITIATQPVEVEFGTEKFNVVATVTADQDVENVEVQLFYNTTIATQTVNLTANEPATVTFEDVENPFAKAGEHTMYVIAGKATAEVAVTVKPEPVEDVIDMAITAIQGLSQINLKAENKATVWYENKGTKDLENVVIMFSVNDDTQEQTVNVAAGKSGYVEFTLDVTSIQPEDENADVVAWVNVEEDADNSNDKVSKVVPVINGEPVVATFAVAAENVTVPFGAKSFDIVAVVENTSDINGEVNVVLKKGIETVATETVNVAAGLTATVTFTIEAPEGGFEAGTAMYYVQAGTDQAEVEVTFEAEPAAEVVDLAIYAINGTISLENEANYVTVWVNNNGNVDVENAKVVLTVGGEGNAEDAPELGEGTVTVKAGQQNVQCKIQLVMDDVEAGVLPVHAEVILPEGLEDATPADNKYDQDFNVAAPAAVLSFTVAEVTAQKDAASFDVKVTVSNTGKVAANNVAVKVYDENSAELNTATIASIAAGADETVTITVNKTYTEAGTFKNQLQVWVAGVEDVKWVAVTVTEGTVGIAAIKAVYGENVQIFNLAGKKVNDVRKGEVYIINGKKVAVK